MSTSSVPAVMAAGLTILRAAFTDPNAVRVLDGPSTPSEDAPPVAVAWGYDGNPIGTRVAVQNWTQTFIGIPVGAQRRQEAYEILGVVAGQTGDEEVDVRRAAVFAAFAVVESAVRSSTLAAWALSPPALIELRSGTLYQEPTGSGLRVRLPFIVAVSQVRI